MTEGQLSIDRTQCEISSRLRKLNISLEITNNEFVLGTIEGVEYYAKYGEREKTKCRCKHPMFHGTETCHYRNCRHSKEEHYKRSIRLRTVISRKPAVDWN